jgi:DNA-directed RNA polymerase subunit N (RpoN/RPB10)
MGVDLRIVDALGLEQRYILSARCTSCGRRIASLFAVTEESMADLKQLLEYAFWIQGPDSTCACRGHLPEPVDLVDDIVRALDPARFGAHEWRDPKAYFVRLTPK